MKTITYQGVQGAFSYITAVKAFGQEHTYRASNTFKEAFELVESGAADYAVLPIENSLIGSIYENYDLLNRYEMHIVGEHYTRIEHCLLTLPMDKKTEALMNIKKVLSHPKALEQCTTFFQEHPWMEAVVHMDTAAAAMEVANRKDTTYAAIASAYAGELYGLQTFEKGIEDDPQNYTRFITLSKKEADEDQIDKCTLMMHVKHQTGALAKPLTRFAQLDFNLTKIESRPLRGNPFEYLFYIELEFKPSEKQKIMHLVQTLEVESIKILGLYKKGSSLWTC